MRTLKFLAVIALAGVVFTGCGKNVRKQQVPSEGRLQSVVWKLIQFDGQSIEAADKYELTFLSTGRIAGVGECNRYFGPYQVINANGGIKIGPVASTMMACLDGGIESPFFGMFEKITLYQFDGDKLYLFEGNTSRAIFQATDKPIAELQTEE